MAKPDLGLPERSTPRARGGCGWCIVLALIALLMLLACGIVALFLTRPPTYTLPNVVISEPPYGAEVIASQPLPVMASASSADRITKQELWVDGLQVYVAVTRDPQGQKDFVAALLWTPKVGQHTLVARALDARGNVGTSPVVRVKVIESAAKEQLPGLLQIAKPGDTIDSIAQENAVTPDQLRQANPGLPDSPPPGEWVNIPPNDQAREGQSDDQAGGAVNDPGAVPIPPGVDIGPANPNSGFPGFGPPLPFWATPADIAPLAPDLNIATGNCAAILTWRDNSNNEAGFYIYRLNRGAPDFSRIATIAANNAHAALRYEDQNIGGDYQYYVAAYSNIGESASRIVQVNIPGQNCWRNLGVQVLEVEAERLTAPGVEEVYCYASLKGHRPFERVPAGQNDYLRWVSPRVPHRPEFVGEWNIGEHYAGANKRIVAAPEGGRAFRVEVECWGARVTNEGGEAFSLGRFDQSHPPAEWDGRALTGRGNSFTLVYHIRPWSGPGGDPNAPLDPDIPAPFDLRRARDFNDCVAHSPGDAGSLLGCAMISYPDKAPLVWEWNGVPAQIDGYRIYFNRVPVGGTFVPIEDVNKDFRVWVEPSQIPCGETWRYAVSAFDLNAESRRSEFIALSGEECDLVLVEVELLALWVQYIDDGWKCTTPVVCLPGTTDHTAEAYGRASFQMVRGGSTEQSRGVDLVVAPELAAPLFGEAYIGPGRVRMRGGETYNWADLPACRNSGEWPFLCDEGYGRNHNKMVFLVRGGEGLRGNVLVWDDDGDSGDDLWCDKPFEFPAMTLDEWARFDQTVGRELSRDTGYGQCSVTVRVRGLQRVGGSRVLAPGGGGPALSSRRANLRIENIQRNRAGNARITIYNAGPDTLIQDAATLQFQVARVESGAGGSPTTIFEHEERALLTIPASGQTTFDTGQVLLEGFESRVHVVVTADNFTDPDLRDNALCRRIDIPDLAHVTIRECAR